jgi:integrase
MLYKRGTKWSYKFMFHGQVIWRATGYTNRQDAAKAESKHKTELNDSANGIPSKPKRMPMFSVAAEQYQAAMRPQWQPSTANNTALSFRLHLLPMFGKRLLSDVNVESVVKYRDQRIAEGASAKSISNELGIVRAMMRYFDLDSHWKAIGKKIKLAPAEKVGRCITDDERRALLHACRESRSRGLYSAVVMALEACMRRSEIRLLHWHNIDLAWQTITVGKSKTRKGTGRVIDMSTLLRAMLSEWAMKFPERKLDHFLFPSEKYGEGGVVYAIDPTTPISSWKEAWEAAKQRAGVQCRFHISDTQDARACSKREWII